MTTINYNVTPVNILATGCFPEIKKNEKKIQLSPGLEEIALKTASEFQRNTSGDLINPDGRLPGWDGEYLSADEGLMKAIRTMIVNSPQAIIPSSKLTSLDASIVKVSENLASEYHNMKKHSHHHNNSIAALGIYIVPIIFDKETPLMMFDTRAEDVFLDPGRLNSVSKAITIKTSDNYLEATLGELAKKYGINMAPNQVKPIGLITDNVHNILLPLGYAKISLAQAEHYNASIIHDVIPVSELGTFIKKHPIEDWTYTGFIAAYGAVQHGFSNSQFSSVKRRFSEEFEKLKKHPLAEKSSLELLKIYE